MNKINREIILNNVKVILLWLFETNRLKSDLTMYNVYSLKYSLSNIIITLYARKIA